MRSFDEILDEYATRKRAYGSILEYMQEARDHVNGDVVIPLPEMDQSEKPAVANLIGHGLEHTAQRVASVLPNLVFPPLIPGKDTGTGSEDWARKRKMAVAGWWQHSKMQLKMRRIARWTIGYARAPIQVEPDFESGMPRFVLRDPLGTFPSLQEDWDDSPPDDVIYSYRRTARWLKARYPDEWARLFPKGTPDSTVVTLIEYNDADDYVLGVLRSQETAYSSGHGLWVPTRNSGVDGGGLELRRFPNRTGMCNSVVANRITFDRLMGQFHQLYGVYQAQATLMALETIAVTKGIFPDIAITSTTPGRTPVLVNGQWEDGRSGKVNVVRDGKVDVLQLNPGFLTQPTMDRMERTMRVQGNIPAQWGGETPGNIATGRLGNQVLSATVDFPIQEYQDILADTLHDANVRGMEVAKAYFGDERKVFHVAFGKAHGRADYKPDTHMETTEHAVTYAAPGADVNALVIGGGQRIGIGGMSVKTWMEQDPLIPDADMEERRITSENMKRTLTDFIAQQIGQGALDPRDVIALTEEIERGATLGEAWNNAQQRAQERQAEQQAQQQAAMAEQGGSMGGPPPEAQPGLAPQPEGESVPAIAGPTPSMENLGQLLGSLRQPRAITSPMGGAASPPSSPVG